MLRLLRSSGLVTALLTAALCPLVIFIAHPAAPHDVSFAPLSGLLMQAIGQDSWIASAMTGVVILLIALGCTVVSNRLEIVQSSALSGWMFMLLAVMIAPGAYMLPVLLASLLVLAAFVGMAAFSDPAVAPVATFNAGFLISLATLLYQPAVVMLVLLVPAFFTARALSARQLTLLILSLAAPYLLAFAGWFMFDRLGEFMSGQFHFKVTVPMLHEFKSPGLIALAAVMIIALFWVAATVGRRVIAERQNVVLLVWLLVLGLLRSAVDATMFPATLMIAAVPVSIFAGDMFHRGAGKVGVELLHIALLAAVGSITYWRLA